MDSEMTLDQVDADGAIRETHEEAVASLDEGDSRRDFLKKTGLAGGAVLGGGALLSALTPAGAAAAAGKGRPPAKFGKGDVGILNFALTLEYLEAAFYNEATENQSKSSFLKRPESVAFLERATIDENAHVAFIKKALGSKAVAAPKVAFGGTTSSEAPFLETSATLENTGVHAYAGQALNLKSSANVAAAASILSIEGRHAAVAAILLSPTVGPQAPNGPFDTPFTAAQVLKAVASTGFIQE